MVSQPVSSLSAVRKQHLLTEFSSLKSACPHGVFMSVTPGDPMVWPGVIFVRKGPYASCILRFQISFPSTYPTLPPLVTFATDIFHPLITPLTTYMYTTDIQDSGTVSATDEERLPPGGFSLRHGFPSWFGRGSRRSAERARGTSLQTPLKDFKGTSELASPESATGSSLSPTPGQPSIGKDSPRRTEAGAYEVLRYIRSTFDDADVLDDVPLQAAGNPGAWHAWRTHRNKSGNLHSPTTVTGKSIADQSSVNQNARKVEEAADIQAGVKQETSLPASLRSPGEWNWDGVWELRVKKGIEGSIAEAALYGSAPADDLIHFLHMQEDEVATIKENIRRSVENAGGGIS